MPDKSIAPDAPLRNTDVQPAATPGAVYYGAQERAAKLKAMGGAASAPDLDWLRDDDPYTEIGSSANQSLWWCSWVQPGFDAPVVSIGGLLDDAESTQVAVDAIERVFAAAGPTGTPAIILRELNVGQPQFLAMVADLIRRRNEVERAAVDLELEVGITAGEVFRELGLPSRSARIRWKGPEECLLVRLPGTAR